MSEDDDNIASGTAHGTFRGVTFQHDDGQIRPPKAPSKIRTALLALSEAEVKIECNQHVENVVFILAGALVAAVLIGGFWAYHAYNSRLFVQGHYCEAPAEKGESTRRWVVCQPEKPEAK